MIKLNAHIVRRIRAHYRRTNNQAATARAFAVDRRRVYYIVHGLHWGHVDVEALPSAEGRLFRHIVPSKSGDKADVVEVIRQIAADASEFTADEIAARMSELGITRQPGLGGVMNLAVAEGICSLTDDFRISARPECRHRPVRIWRSEIFEPSARRSRTRTRTKEKTR